MRVKTIDENSNNFFVKNAQFFMEFADILRKRHSKMSTKMRSVFCMNC